MRWSTVGLPIAIAFLLVPADGSANLAEWTRLTPPSTSECLQVFDSNRREVRLLSLGNAAAPDEEWVLALDHPERWRRTTTGGAGPEFDDARMAVYDARLDRVLVLARDASFPIGATAPLVVWARSLGNPDSWHVLQSQGKGPPERFDASLVFDTKREVFVLFGGSDRGFENPRFHDVWRLHAGLNEVEWEQVIPSGDTLADRSGAGAIYDARRDRLVLFGGSVGLGGSASSSVSNDVVSVEFSPEPRATLLSGDEEFERSVTRATCVYDSLADQMVVVSYDSWSPAVRSLALDDLATWSVVIPTTDGNNLLRARYAALDAGGRGGVTVAVSHSVHSFSLGPFGNLSRVDPGDDHVPRGTRSSPTYPSFPDGRDGSVLVWGGFLGEEESLRQSMWRFAPDQFPHWRSEPLAGDVPPSRRDATLAYDGRRDRWFLFGGSGATSDTTSGLSNELWSYDVGRSRWTRMDRPGQSPPTPRAGASMVYDGLRDRLVLFGGGITGGVRYPNDLWEWSFAGGGGWQEIHATGSPPHARYGAAAIYDPSADRMVVYGGQWNPSTGGIGLANNPVTFGDTWFLDFGAGAVWDSVEAIPPSLVGGADQFAFFHPVRRAMDVFGLGRPIRPQYLTHVALRSLRLTKQAGWQDINVGGTWGTRAVAFDPTRDRMFTFGGSDLSSAWVLDRHSRSLVAYVDVLPKDPANVLRARGHATIEVALLGTPLVDVADVDPSTPVLASATALPDHRSDRANLRDLNGDGNLDRLFRFDTDALEIPDNGLVQFTAQTRVGLTLIAFDRIHVDAVSGGASATVTGDPDSPTDVVRPLALFATRLGQGPVVLRLDLPRKADVLLEIFAVNGRRVVRKDLGVLDAGPHELQGEMSGLGSGLYFARVRAGAESVNAKVVMIR